VFERLQQNTTEAYDKHVAPEDDTLDKRQTSYHANIASPARKKPKQPHSPRGTAASSEREDVFERLQKHTTEAYANKKTAATEQTIEAQSEVRNLRSNAIETGSFGSHPKQEQPLETRDIGSSESEPKAQRSKAPRQETPSSPHGRAKQGGTTSGDVFERLQTTSAFAKKKTSQADPA
jgi:hypothetical protein